MTTPFRITWLAPLVLFACGGGDEAVRVELPVVTAGGALPAATSDLGYTVTVDRLRIAVSTLELTVAGEMHQAGLKAAPPRPHPGHNAGGEVTGELPGAFVLTWDGNPHPVGIATLLVGDYNGANLGFRAADAADGLAGDDPLHGHTFHLVGRARRDGAEVPFDAVLDVEAGTSLVGASFDHDVTESSTETLALRFLPADPFLNQTAFDGVDFATLALTEGTAVVRPGESAHNVLRRKIQIHDHYAIEVR